MMPMGTTGISKILFISFCLLRYSAMTVNTLKTQRTSEIVHSISIIALSPTSVKQGQSGIDSTIGQDVLHRSINDRNKAQSFSDPAKTETFKSSLKLLPSITVITPDIQNLRKSTFSQLVLSASKTWTTSSTLTIGAGTNQWKFNEIVTTSSLAIFHKPALPHTEKINTAYSDINSPLIYIKGNRSVYVNEKLTITTREESITFTEGKLTTKSPPYIENKEVLMTKSPPYIKDKDEEKLTTKPPPYIKDKDEEILMINTPPYTKEKDEEKLTTKSPPYIKDKDKEILTINTPPYTKDKDEKLPRKEDKIEEIRPHCPRWLSCKDRCGFERQFSYEVSCFCDPECAILEDCCADFDEYCNATIMLESGWVESEFVKRWECWKAYDDNVPIWMIRQCQPGWNDADTLRRCTEKNTDIISELIPVIDQYNNTFFNRYCAICNNVTKFSQWEFKVYCDVIPPAGYTEAQWAMFLDLFGSIDSFSLTQTWGKRYCIDDVHSSCSIWDDEEIVEGCLFGLTGLITVKSNYKHYRNWDCLLCSHNIIPPYTQCGPVEPLRNPHQPDRPISYSSIFRASSLPLPQSRCPQHQIYDETFGKCKVLLAKNNINLGNVLKRYAIILEYNEHSNNCGITLFTAVLESSNVTRRFKDVFQKFLEINLIERDSKVLDINIQPLGNFSYRVIFELLENSVENEIIDSNIGHELKIQNLTFHSHIRNLTKLEGLCKYSLNKSIVRKMLCAQNETFFLNEVEIYFFFFYFYHFPYVQFHLYLFTSFLY